MSDGRVPSTSPAATDHRPPSSTFTAGVGPPLRALDEQVLATHLWPPSDHNPSAPHPAGDTIGLVLDTVVAQDGHGLTSQALETHPSPTRQVPISFASTLSRDALLSYAYQLYRSAQLPHLGLTAIPLVIATPAPTSPEQIYRLRLLPLLTTLCSLHPGDIRILLLLACTYHSLGDYNMSLSTSQEMLRIDPASVEAMNNIGVTLKALGRNDQAYEWWWKAIQACPTYWDATENILGLLFTHAQSARGNSQSSMLYARALDACVFVQRKIITSDGRLILPVPPHDLPRLQKLLLTSATIQGMSSPDSMAVVSAYFQSLELMISPPAAFTSGGGYTARELILAGFLATYILQLPPSNVLPPELSQSVYLPRDITSSALLTSGINLLDAVRASGDRILAAILRLGGSALPFLLLLPEQVSHLPALLFPVSSGALPAICTETDEDGRPKPASDAVRQEANVMTGTILLALAKRYQDLASNKVSLPGFSAALNVNHSLSIMLYYLALSLFPSPSTYNNMGIVLSSMSATIPHVGSLGDAPVLTGSVLARVYYTTGLQMDPNNPHLLTNLGSLFKDQGNLEEAIQLYAKAIAVKPDFDVALANMGNAIKDVGRGWEALEYYRRAVEINPDLPEAVCGLMNSMASVCDWRGRSCFTDEYGVDDQGHLLAPTSAAHVPRPGLMHKIVDMCERQLRLAYDENVHAMSTMWGLGEWLRAVEAAFGRALREHERATWVTRINQFYKPLDRMERHVNEGGFLIRVLNWLQPRLQRQWYVRLYGKALRADQEGTLDPLAHKDEFVRPLLPRTMSPPVVPSLLPFNTFVYPLSARMIRLIPHRNALRISFAALSQPWLPPHVYPPPPPPKDGVLNIGYVSNDVNNHPLSHLMQSVFGLHDRSRFRVFMYTSSPWDGTSYRPKISGTVEVFVDASTWSSEQIVKHVTDHRIHVLINLGGYTKGARNDVFAARPCPCADTTYRLRWDARCRCWCDYLVCDPISAPKELCAAEVWRKTKKEGARHDDLLLNLDADPDPEDPHAEWVYSEKFIYMPHTFMVTDHKQSFRTDENLSLEERLQTPADTLWRNEELRRQEMRQTIFPDLPHTVVIFANFNQLYKIDPGVFAAWLRILVRVPNSILWLLRFPAQGEEHLLRQAQMWAGNEVASRVKFTDVARKHVHVHRGRVADLFLDTMECNAHTIAGDILWPGTPLITFPKHPHKMCSRVAASMANATGFGDEMVVDSLEAYENRAVALANSISYVPETEPGGTTVLRGQGELIRLRRNLFLNRDRMPLFDTARWTRNIEKAYWEAWRRWVEGTQFELSDEWEACKGPEKESGCIWVQDDDPAEVVRYD
ncbi:glycosyltransferase family 41 protein [Phanerochaete carnosa HHB-10118-sp]|uniref:protein O-GlcNAc transferase n=1 Tax=Phanerochaete carnosa (strain HHB-10118-sp) TaxID=650164 RepID=K5VDI3_PHACS|nr:glycosyltransferase family 41 protein [Phanerochaete carnosa HHB-10118-sp]EKM61041.1 glycosyltransferase family 41 protein [Phanerochaete carnosa HHB-10118-sp]